MNGRDPKDLSIISAGGEVKVASKKDKQVSGWFKDIQVVSDKQKYLDILSS